MEQNQNETRQVVSVTYDVKKFHYKGFNCVKLEYVHRTTYSDKSKVEMEVSITSQNEPHNDLMQWFKQSLSAHLLDLCEYGSYVAATLDNESFALLVTQNKIEANGIVYGGSDESAGCTIIGKKTLRENRVLNLVAPFVNYANDQCWYSDAGWLAEQAEALRNEIILYINGKYAPPLQLDLFKDNEAYQEKQAVVLED